MVDWNRSASAHLVRRTAFGARKREVDAALADGSAAAAAARLVAEARAAARPAAPPGLTSGSDIDRVYAIQRHWYAEMLGPNGLREKMTLFLHNLLAVQYADAGMAPLCWPYLQLLREHALGSYRELIERIGVEPAMLRYLNGDQSVAGAANENYGRELLELFTMGQTGPDGSANYTEQDIKEAARALTGWTVSSRGTASFDRRRHDAGAKTFLGQTGPWQHDDVVRIAFEQRGAQIAWFVCRKLVAFFVEAEPDADLVGRLAATFEREGFALAPVVEELLASDAFYRADLRAARVKTPVELMVGQMRELEVAATDELLEEVRVALEPARLGCELLNPPNVAGWPGMNPPGSDGSPGHYAWLTTSTLPLRWQRTGALVGSGYDPVELARKVSDPSNPFALAVDLARLMLPVGLDQSSVRPVTTPWGGDVMANPLPQALLDGPSYAVDLTKILLDGSPWYEWPPFVEGGNPENESAARELLRSYVRYLAELPEYQLT